MTLKTMTLKGITNEENVDRDNKRTKHCVLVAQ